VNTLSPFLAWLLVVLTLGIAAFFAWQQFRSLAWLKANPELSDEDQRYFRKQAIRRLIGCGLLVAVSGMIAAYYVSGLDDWTTRVGEQVAEKGADVVKNDPEVQRMKDVFRWYAITVLLLLLALVIVAALDYWAIRGYGLRHMKQISSDRKAMLERELAELRKSRGYRNGQG
jgi:H+/Cl- antiporter ClcA